MTFRRKIRSDLLVGKQMREKPPNQSHPSPLTTVFPPDSQFKCNQPNKAGLHRSNRPLADKKNKNAHHRGSLAFSDNSTTSSLGPRQNAEVCFPLFLFPHLGRGEKKTKSLEHPGRSSWEMKSSPRVKSLGVQRTSAKVQRTALSPYPHKQA